MTLIDTTTSTAITYQTIAIQRRLRVSPSVARTYASLVFGERAHENNLVMPWAATGSASQEIRS